MRASIYFPPAFLPVRLRYFLFAFIQCFKNFSCVSEISETFRAFIDMVVRVSHLLATYQNILELDINPVRVFESGALALDARARIAAG